MDSHSIRHENLAVDFYNLLKERFDNNVYTTERNITYTFFATMVMFDYYKPHEILLEYNHPNIKGYKKVDTYIKSNDNKNGLVMECKYDRKMPSGHNSPRPQKAGKIFNDFFRLASFTNDENVIKWLIYLTDEEMTNYFNNVENKLNDFFNLAKGAILIIDDEYLKNKSQTFNGGIDTNGISKINIKCIFQNDLPNNHKIKIYEVEIPNDVVFPNYDVNNNQSNIDIKHKDNMEKSAQIKHSNISHSHSETIVKDMDFIYDNKKYIARAYKLENNSHVYYKILLKGDENQNINSIDIARKYLRSFGISTTPDMNTHRTVKIIMDILEKNTKS